MFGIGMPELMLIFVLALLIFGPKELPRIARTLGKAMGELRRASDELRDGIQREIELAERADSSPPPSGTVASTTATEGSSAAPETHADPLTVNASTPAGASPEGTVASATAEPTPSAQGELFVQSIPEKKEEPTNNSLEPSLEPSNSNEGRDGQRKSAEGQPETKTVQPAPVQSVETRTV